jgi:hypothetical protein
MQGHLGPRGSGSERAATRLDSGMPRTRTLSSNLVMAAPIPSMNDSLLPRDLTAKILYLFAKNFKLQASSVKLQASSFKLQASSFKIQASSFKLQDSSFKLQASSIKLQASSFKLQASSFKLQASTELPPAREIWFPFACNLASSPQWCSAFCMPGTTELSSAALLDSARVLVGINWSTFVFLCMAMARYWLMSKATRQSTVAHSADKHKLGTVGRG